MAIPFFGFRSTQPNIPFPQKRIPDFGDYFLGAFQPAYEQSARQFHESQESELDRAFRERENRRDRAQKIFLQEDSQAEVRQQDERLGNVIPATPDNLEYLRQHLTPEQMERATYTTRTGEAYIHKPYYDAIQRSQINRMDLVPSIDPEEPEFLERTLGEDYAFGEETIESVTDEDGYTSPEALQRYIDAANLRLDVYGKLTERERVVRAGQAEQVDDKDLWQAFNRRQEQRLIDRRTGEEITGPEKAAISMERAQLETGFIVSPQLQGPNGTERAAELYDNYEYMDPLGAEEMKAAAREVISIGATKEGAGNFMRTTGAAAMNNGFSADGARQIFGTSGVLDDGSVDPSDAQVQERVRQSPQLRAALYLMQETDNAEQLEQFFRDFGGYNRFRDLFSTGVISHMQTLSPERYGSFSIAEASGPLSPPPGVADTSHTGLDDPEVAARRRGSAADSSAAPRDSVAADNQVTASSVYDAIGQNWEVNMRYDPGAAEEISQFLLTIADPETGAEEIIRELEDVARLSAQVGDFTEEDLQASQVLLAALQFQIESDRENFVRKHLPLLQAEFEEAKERLRRNQFLD